MRSTASADLAHASGAHQEHKAHIIHLSGPAWAAIFGYLGEPDAYVFGTSRGKSFQAFANGKHALDRLCKVSGWRLHDLRMTLCASNGSRCSRGRYGMFGLTDMRDGRPVYPQNDLSTCSWNPRTFLSDDTTA